MWWVAGMAALVLFVAGCGDDDSSGGDSAASDAVEQSAGIFVGTVEGTDAYIAVVTEDPEPVTAFLTDGTPDRAPTVAVFLLGRVVDGTLDVSAPEAGPGSDVEVLGTVHAEEVTGNVYIADEPHPFTADAVEPPAGLYEQAGTQAEDGRALSAGWVVAPDGTQRGALQWGLGEWRPAPMIDPTGTDDVVVASEAGDISVDYDQPGDEIFD